MAKKLCRTVHDRWIAGFCGGLGKYLDIDSNIVRIIYIVLCFVSLGIMILVYILAVLILPAADENESDVIDAEYVIK